MNHAPRRHPARSDFRSPTPSRRLTKAPALCLALALGLALSGCQENKAASGPAATGPAQVGVVTLRAESHTFTTELPGRTSAFLVAEVRPQVGGIVQKRLFTEGAQVKAGQPLYQIDPATFEVAVATARAQLSKAQANERAAQVNAARTAELIKARAISQQQYDDSQTQLAQSGADLAAARAALRAAELNLGYTQIKAPIAGRTSASSVTPGALLTANQAQLLTTITQSDPLYVDITQSTTELLRLKRQLAEGQLTQDEKGAARITLVLDDGSTYAHEGTLQFSGVQVNPASGAITLRATVPNPEGLLMPGMYVRARLQQGVSEHALLAPQQAVTRDPTGAARVLVVKEDDTLESRRIVTGNAVDNRWEVLSGLAPGERILVDGSQRVKAGDKVRPIALQQHADAPPAADGQR
ncbi:efflux RND transporter periplasmic adaptor subunit [Comamonas flocculans]|uniref:Efflux RND transporter periplasmic adaptor subunit n=1 Tax=Comamonas flocculans TaxID=2597701 RepID=A0A5B8S056_9BURK|nr:efflux RND transporter periplasmic adaptor subunit [Comamonas flocculans]QEA13965.1 efflux RND transporter periplasmic adaptor subunit [Comamonas flocculans]